MYVYICISITNLKPIIKSNEISVMNIKSLTVNAVFRIGNFAL